MNSANISFVQVNRPSYMQTYNKFEIPTTSKIKNDPNIDNVLACNVSDRMLVQKSNVYFGLNLNNCKKQIGKYAKENPNIIIEKSDIENFARILCENKLSKRQLEFIMNNASLNCCERQSKLGKKFTDVFRLEKEDLKSALESFKNTKLFKCEDTKPDFVYKKNPNERILKIYLERNPEIIFEKSLLDEFIQVINEHNFSKKELLDVMKGIKAKSKGKEYQVRPKVLHTAINKIVNSKYPGLEKQYNSPYSREKYELIVKNYMKKNPQVFLGSQTLDEFIQIVEYLKLPKEDVLFVLDEMKPKTRNEVHIVQQESLNPVLNKLIVSKNPLLFEKYKSLRTKEEYSEIIDNYLKKNPKVTIDAKVRSEIINELHKRNMSGKNTCALLDTVKRAKTNAIGCKEDTINIQLENFLSALGWVERIQKRNLFDEFL